MIGAVIRREGAAAASAEPVEEMGPAEIAADKTLNDIPTLSLVNCSDLQAIKRNWGTGERYRIQRNWYGRGIRSGIAEESRKTRHDLGIPVQRIKNR